MVKKKVVLNLGCGGHPMKDAINIDCLKFKGVDAIMDLNKKWDFSDNYADEVHAYHLLEHLKYFHFMREAWRVLKPHGRLYLKVPHFTSYRAHIGEHKTPGFSWMAFENFKFDSQPFHIYKVVKNRILFGKKLSFISWLVNKRPMLYERFFCFLLPANELDVILEKKSREEIPPHLL